jgi:hypothetical protein|tara:strand:- start:15 stop:782 length:768 start_codon:yes stop_codon:yes gene_type:complete
MAVTETRQLVNPTLEGSLTAFLKKLDPLGGQAINTATYAPQVAARNALQTAPETAAAGLGALTGTGAGGADVAGSIASYMSPYQQQVIDASLAEFDRNAAVQQTGLRDAAISRGAYGGGREGVMQAEAMRNNQMNRASLQAQLLNQGFNQAQQARAGDLAAQQGLGQYQQALGQAQQGFEQAKLDATQIANREAEFEDFTRLGLVGQQLAQIQPGAFASQTVGYAPPAAPASPMTNFLTGAAGGAGIMGKLGLFG